MTKSERYYIILYQKQKQKNKKYAKSKKQKYANGDKRMRKTAGELLIELNMALRGACESAGERGDPITLRIKALYLLSEKPRTPIELMDRLCMVKSNLALMCNRMTEDGEIEKAHSSEDKRAVTYTITEKGMRTLGNTVKLLEDKFKGILTTEKEYDEGIEKFNSVLDLLSFI